MLLRCIDDGSRLTVAALRHTFERVIASPWSRKALWAPCNFSLYNEKKNERSKKDQPPESSHRDHKNTRNSTLHIDGYYGYVFDVRDAMEFQRQRRTRSREYRSHTLAWQLFNDCFFFSFPSILHCIVDNPRENLGAASIILTQPFLILLTINFLFLEKKSRTTARITNSRALLFTYSCRL